MKTNSTIESILNRRSCRAYTAEMPTDEQLDTILNAGLYAASGMGKQSAVMVSVTNREVRNILSRLNASVLGSNVDPFYGAPVVIAVLADKTMPTFVEDGALVMENIMLAAYSLGLSSCWIHRAREIFSSGEGKKLKKQWGLSDSYEGIGFCIIGHAAASDPKPQPRKANRIVKIQ